MATFPGSVSVIVACSITAAKRAGLCYDLRAQKEGTMATKETVEAYMAVWNETDEDKRRALLAKVWAASATYTDPMAHAAGAEELVALVSGFHTQMPGAKIVQTSAIDEHHRRLRFGWAMKGPDRSPRGEGIDIGGRAGEGPDRRSLGFCGPLPAG